MKRVLRIDETQIHNKLCSNQSPLVLKKRLKEKKENRKINQRRKTKKRKRKINQKKKRKRQTYVYYFDSFSTPAQAAWSCSPSASYSRGAFSNKGASYNPRFCGPFFAISRIKFRYLICFRFRFRLCVQIT